MPETDSTVTTLPSTGASQRQGSPVSMGPSHQRNRLRRLRRPNGLFVVSLVVALGLWIVPWFVQFVEPFWWDPQWPTQPDTLVFTASNDKSVTVEAVYPRTLLADPAAPLSSLVLYLSPTTATSSITRTVWLKTSVGSNGLTLADDKGQPSPGMVPLAESRTGYTVARLYLRAQPHALFATTSITVGIQPIPEAGGLFQPAQQDITFQIAPAALAWLFRYGRSANGAAALLALAAALVGVFMEWWKRQAEAAQKEQEQQAEKAEKEIDELRRLLADEQWSKAADQYERLIMSDDALWNEPERRQQVKQVWDTGPEPNLTAAVRLILQGPDGAEADAATQPTVDEIRALCWTLTQLDARWADRSRDRLLLMRPKKVEEEMSECFERAERAQRLAFARPWPRLMFWRRSHWPHLPLPNITVDDPGHRDAIYSAWAACDDPLGEPRAEDDWALLHYVTPPTSVGLRPYAVEYVLGGPGSGKTATACLLAYETYFESHRFQEWWAQLPCKPELLFPVYYALGLGVGQRADHLSDVGRVLSETLLYWLAARPNDFLNLSEPEQAAIAHLWLRCIGSHRTLALRLTEAGLSSGGVGKAVLNIVEGLTRGVHFTRPFSPEDVLDLARGVRPYGRKHTLFLIDVSDAGGPPGETVNAQLAEVIEVAENLAAVGGVVAVFLPSYLATGRGLNAGRSADLIWQPADLQPLLTRRLKMYSRGELLSKGLVERLVTSANGSPHRLVLLANRILHEQGKNKRLLTAEEQDTILQSVPLDVV